MVSVLAAKCGPSVIQRAPLPASDKKQAAEAARSGSGTLECFLDAKFDRAAQDEFAKESYRRARSAQEKGEFKAEIAAVTVSSKGADLSVDADEEPGRANLEKMSSLKPAFAKDGTITAANASKINDGAAALVLASADAVKQHGLKPLARIVSYGSHAQAPEWFTTAPVGAIKAALSRAQLTAQDVDLYEINEAFAIVTMAAERDLEIPHDRVNVRGGAVALGHPIGASGARVLTTLLYAMHDRQVKRGLATLCIGGGEALALIVERV